MRNPRAPPGAGEGAPRAARPGAAAAGRSAPRAPRSRVPSEAAGRGRPTWPRAAESRSVGSPPGGAFVRGRSAALPRAVPRGAGRKAAPSPLFGALGSSVLSVFPPGFALLLTRARSCRFPSREGVRPRDLKGSPPCPRPALSARFCDPRKVGVLPRRVPAAPVCRAGGAAAHGRSGGGG